MGGFASDAAVRASGYKRAARLSRRFPPVRLILRGQRAGEFRDDQPPEWMITVLLALLHAAAAEVIAERLNEDAATQLIHGSFLAAIDHRPSE